MRPAGGSDAMRAYSSTRARHLRAAAVCFAAFAIAPAWAGNGLNVLSFGARSLGLGGADLAAPTDSSAVVNNPAALAPMRQRILDLTLDPYHMMSTSHSDSLGNNQRTQPTVGAFAGGGYVQPIGDRLTAGAALLVQGGVGFGYDDLDTGFGTRDEVSANFGVIRLASGIGWQATSRMSVGASVGLSYATARQKYFPETSVLDASDPGQSLFGMRLDGLRALGVNGAVGVHYRATPAVYLALAYRSKTPLQLDGGRLTVNYEAIDAGRVVYRDAELKGLNIAQDLAFGVGFAPARRWQLTGKLSWIDWSSAVKRSTLLARAPDRQPDGVPDTIRGTTPLGFRDQDVLAVGVSRELEPGSHLRLGYNYARQPVPREHLTPTFAVIAEHHYMIGYGTSLWRLWDVDVALQYQPRSSVRYANPDTPITAQAIEQNEAVYLHLMLSRRWP
jgi:long-chain fatty acid transport protein